jgi:NADH-quinone oxidoreductase subunit G
MKGRYAFDFTHSPERLQSPMIRTATGLQPASWSEALELVARKFGETMNRGGRFGVIGSNHTTNEENFYLQKFARQVLGTNNIDHHRTGDVPSLLDALSGRSDALASTSDLYERKAILIIGADLSQQHPFLAFQIRANYRHHGAHVYTVTSGPVRERKLAAKSIVTPEGDEFSALDSLREQLKAEPELVILFGDSITGGKVQQLVAFGEQLGIPVKYVCLVDYSNSRGAADMGLLSGLGPGYQGVSEIGLTYDQILSGPDLDVLWVVGANPLKAATLASSNAFVVLQDMFLTETAQRADVVFPAASAYEKNGTVTNVCGEVQRLKAGLKVMGTKSDLEIMGLISKEMGVKIGIWTPEKVFEEIRSSVHGYNIPLPVIATGGAAQTTPVNGRVAAGSLPDSIRSARDTLYTSGSLGRYSKTLSSVIEAPGTLYQG